MAKKITLEHKNSFAIFMTCIFVSAFGLGGLETSLFLTFIFVGPSLLGIASLYKFGIELTESEIIIQKKRFYHTKTIKLNLFDFKKLSLIISAKNGYLYLKGKRRDGDLVLIKLVPFHTELEEHKEELEFFLKTNPCLNLNIK